jgi:hypothetical protein
LHELLPDAGVDALSDTLTAVRVISTEGPDFHRSQELFCRQAEGFCRQVDQSSQKEKGAKPFAQPRPD